MMNDCYPSATDALVLISPASRIRAFQGIEFTECET